jgi:hypothetical protein
VPVTLIALTCVRFCFAWDSTAEFPGTSISVGAGFAALGTAPSPTAKLEEGWNDVSHLQAQAMRWSGPFSIRGMSSVIEGGVRMHLTSADGYWIEQLDRRTTWM